MLLKKNSKKTLLTSYSHNSEHYKIRGAGCLNYKCHGFAFVSAYFPWSKCQICLLEIPVGTIGFLKQEKVKSLWELLTEGRQDKVLQ